MRTGPGDTFWKTGSPPKGREPFLALLARFRTDPSNVGSAFQETYGQALDAAVQDFEKAILMPKEVAKEIRK